MIAFWSVAAALTVVALAFMIAPLARKAKSEAAAPGRGDFDITVYKDQLAEVDRDLERGVLSEDQALAARTEIERRMLAVAQEQDSALEIAETAKPKSSMALIAAIMVAVPLGAVAFYLYLGQPELRDQPLAQRQVMQQQAQAQGQGEGGDTRARAMELLAQLEQRLKDNPKDIEGWLILAQVYEAMNRHTDAANAYENVVNLTERHPEALTAWAEAQIMAEQTVVIPEVAKLLKEIKQKDPTEPRSYFYLALERQQHDDLRGALDEYVQLLEHSPSDAEWVEQIQDRMKSLANEMGIDVPVVAMLPPAGPPADATADAPGPTAEQMQDAQQMTPEERQAMVQSMVQRLADRLKENPDDLAGWQRLAQAYRVMGDTAKLAEAEAQIARLQGGATGSATGGAAAAPGPSVQQMQDAQQMSTDDRQAMIQSMVQRLADRLKENPDDLAGWQRLAKAYQVMGNADGVAEAEAQIKRLQAQ
ncbi:c-type cytochrome biogenesis protein CcmI [Magnetovibrio sp.]|uniref:c-type cytochrome biogenesis protein CcmI n=1 Tax=Magnetovibrio sp. TaxID=2024836 RepID=UPI002F957D91